MIKIIALFASTSCIKIRILFRTFFGTCKGRFNISTLLIDMKGSTVGSTFLLATCKKNNNKKSSAKYLQDFSIYVSLCCSSLSLTKQAIWVFYLHETKTGFTPLRSEPTLMQVQFLKQTCHYSLNNWEINLEKPD